MVTNTAKLKEERPLQKSNGLLLLLYECAHEEGVMKEN